MEATADPAIRKIRQAAAKIEPLHEKKRPPSPHDWLAQHEESGQSFDEYLKSNPNRPTATRTKLYVQPLGAFNDRQRRLVEETAELMSLFYNLPVEMLDPIGLDLIPPKARRTHPKWGDKQILTTFVLDPSDLSGGRAVLRLQDRQRLSACFRSSRRRLESTNQRGTPTPCLSRAIAK